MTDEPTSLAPLASTHPSSNATDRPMDATQVQESTQVGFRKHLRLRDAAAYIGVSAPRLDRMSRRGIGPAFTVIPNTKTKSYFIGDLDDFMERNRVIPYLPSVTAAPPIPRLDPPRLTDEQWASIAPLIPASLAAPGGADGTRAFIDGCLYMSALGRSWAHLPLNFGISPEHSSYLASLWGCIGLWYTIFAVLDEDQSFPFFMITTSSIVMRSPNFNSFSEGLHVITQTSDNSEIKNLRIFKRPNHDKYSEYG